MKKRLALLTTIIFAFAIYAGGCATMQEPTHQGGKLFTSAKTPMDGFFLQGNLEYVKKNLKVSSYADNKAKTVSNLIVKYSNRGEDGIELKVTCCWANSATTCLKGSAQNYSEHLFPYSSYIIREGARKPAQSGTHFICDHRETFTSLWNNKELNTRE